MVDNLLRQLKIAGGSLTIGVIEKDGLAETGSFGQAYIARDHGSENLVAEEIAQVVANLVSEVGALVEHGKEDSLHS
jgi:hypothetical protein